MSRISTSEQILEVASDLIQTRGYNDFSYADISITVGIRKASIHYHFPTKSSLGRACIGTYKNALENELAQIEERHSTAHDRLYALIAHYAEIVADKRCLAASLLSDRVSLDEEIVAIVDSYYETLTEWVRAQAKGQIVDINFARSFVVLLTHGWYLGDNYKFVLHLYLDTWGIAGDELATRRAEKVAN